MPRSTQLLAQVSLRRLVLADHVREEVAVRPVGNEARNEQLRPRLVLGAAGARVEQDGGHASPASNAR
jgi:hypothetical protein